MPVWKVAFLFIIQANLCHFRHMATSQEFCIFAGSHRPLLKYYYEWQQNRAEVCCCLWVRTGAFKKLNIKFLYFYTCKVKYVSLFYFNLDDYRSQLMKIKNPAFQNIWILHNIHKKLKKKCFTEMLTLSKVGSFRQLLFGRGSFCTNYLKAISLRHCWSIMEAQVALALR